MGSRGHVPLIRFAATLNIDTQDRQDEKRVRSKGSTPVGFLRGQPDAPRERGRPARILSTPPRLSTLPADAASVGAGGEPWPGSRLIRAGGVGPGCARTGAGGTPALPGGGGLLPSLLLLKGGAHRLAGPQACPCGRTVSLGDPSWISFFGLCGQPSIVSNKSGPCPAGQIIRE